MNVLASAMTGDEIRKAREARGWTQAKLASVARTNQATVDRIESGQTRHSKYLAAIRRVLGLETTMPAATVPLVGYVGAGSEAHYYDGADNPQDEAPMPPGGTASTVAVEVRGDSLGSLFNRWLVYYDDRRDPVTVDLLRKLCVVGLTDGRVLVKKIMRGSSPGLFHLVSQTEGVIEDVAILWAAEVKAMVPR